MVGSAQSLQEESFESGLLEYPHLFHPFFVPVFLLLAAILQPGLARREHSAAAEPGALFLSVSSVLLLVPLVFFGAWFSRMLISAGHAWRPAANGSVIAFAILVLAAAAAVFCRRSPAAIALIATGAFGVINAANTPLSQPAYLYDVRHRCSFRRDFFSAFLEVDKVLAAFDPDNHARWTHPMVGFDVPQFNGRNWCERLPVDTVARDILLSHYFFTSAQFTKGYKMPGPPRKLVISAVDPRRADRMLFEFRQSNAPGAKFVQSLALTIKRPTFSVLLRGYDITTP